MRMKGTALFFRKEDVVVSAINSQPLVSTTGLGVQSGSPDNTVVDIFTKLTDETGRFSDDEKMSAWKKYAGLGETVFRYSLDDRKLLNSLSAENSSFFKKNQDFSAKVGNATGRWTDKSIADSARVQAHIDFYDSLSQFEKDLFIASLSSVGDDHRDMMAAQKKAFLYLEQSVAAGTFQWGTPLDKVTDSKTRLALMLLGNLDTNPAVRRQAFKEADTLNASNFGALRDTISLSDQARKYLGQS